MSKNIKDYIFVIVILYKCEPSTLVTRKTSIHGLSWSSNSDLINPIGLFVADKIFDQSDGRNLRFYVEKIFTILGPDIKFQKSNVKFILCR